MSVAPVSSIATASGAINRALQRFDASAARTAARPFDDLAAETVERIEAKAAVQANIAVLRTADGMVGTLLDILA